MRLIILSVCIMFVLPGILAGCSETDILEPDAEKAAGERESADVGDITGQFHHPLPFADTPIQLMTNFETAYERRDVDDFVDLLHEDFKIFLQAETVEEFGLPESFFTRDEMAVIHDNIFSGEPINTPWGLVAGVARLRFTEFAPAMAWDVAPANDPNFPGALYCAYDIRLEFPRPGDTTLIVTGPAKFYVINQPQDDDGVLRDHYTLLGMVDYTGSPFGRTEEINWGSVMALYR